MTNQKTYNCQGVCPLILHNGFLAHPLNDYSRAIKKISSKRKKMDQDYEDMAELEFKGSLYWGKGQEPCISKEVIRGVLMGKGGASRKQRMGKQAELGIIVLSDAQLLYDGPSDPDELWQDGRFRFDSMEKVGPAKIARTRPIFHEWSMVVNLEYNNDFINEEMLDHLMVIAGAESGIGDRRPTYGRFEVNDL